jgi:enamine deaminase RidA (YjgF/YER057c/UK114 family)
VTLPVPPPTTARVAERRFLESGLGAVRPAVPLANYAPASEFGGLVFMSGHGPLDGDRQPVVVGTLGADVSIDDGVRAAKLATSNLLASLRMTLGTLDRVSAVCELRCYLRCAPGFAEQERVVSGASGLIIEIFGAAVGAHVPTIVSVSECVLGLAVTVDAIFSVTDSDTVGE